MKIQLPKPTRLYWSDQLGWTVDVDVPLSLLQLQGIIDWALPRQLERLHSLPSGDRREALKSAIAKLKSGKLTQRVINDNGVGAVYAATERTTNTDYSY